MAPRQCILFAGAVGSSKTPIASYLSYNLGLPVFNNDAIRSEVIEDAGYLDDGQYLKRRDERLAKLLSGGMSFILDGSIDREWEKVSEALTGADYSSFIISLDLSGKLLEKLHRDKIYHESIKNLDKYLADHLAFIERFGDRIGVRVDDSNFSRRLDVCLEAAKKFIK